MAAALPVTTVWSGDQFEQTNDSEDNGRFAPHFVAEGRIGDGAAGATHEVDVGETTSAFPAPGEQTASVAWTDEASYAFTFTYDPDVKKKARFQINGADVWWEGAAFGSNSTDLDAMFLRTFANVSGSTMTLSNLALATPELSGSIYGTGKALPIASGSGNASGVVDEYDSSTRSTSLRVTGVRLQAGFTLTGTAKFDWSGTTPPTNSNLAFQLKVGTWTPSGQPGDCGCVGGQCQVNQSDGLVEGAFASSAESSGFGTGVSNAMTVGGNAEMVLDGPGGYGTVAAGLPYLLQGNNGNTVIAVGGAAESSQQFFDLAGAGIESAGARHGNRNTLTSGASEVVVNDQGGSRTVYYGFGSGVSAALQGKLKKYIDADGGETSVQSYDSAGRPLSLRRTSGSGSTATVEEFVYTYVSSGDNAGRMESVLLRRSTDNGTTFTPVRKTEYAYYTSSDTTNGAVGDLKTQREYDVVISGGTPTFVQTDIQYFRWYRENEANGYSHGLKMMFSAATFARLDADSGGSTDPFTADQEIAKLYADRYFKYDNQRRVTEEFIQGEGCSACTGGVAKYTYSYIENPHYYDDVAATATAPSGVFDKELVRNI